MSGIGKNRVFDTAAIEELKSQVMNLMQTATEVTETIQNEMNTLTGIAADIPAEAKHNGLDGAASALAGNLDTAIYEELRTKIANKLDELNAQVPAYDSASAAVLTELTGAAGNLIYMIDGLKSMIGQGSLHMSLTEFTEKLEEYKTAWAQGGMDLDAKMQLAMTFLKGLVLFSEFSRDPVNLSTGNFYYEKEDITLRGLMPLTFKRHYNAIDKDGGILGQGWSHSLEERLTFAGEGETKSPILHLADGQEIAFKPDEKEPGQYRDIHTGTEELYRNEDGYSYRKGILTRLFDTEGHLLKKEDTEGNAIVYAYDENGRLEKAAQSPSGGYILFTYKEDGTLKTATDHTGRSVTFFFMEGKLTEVTDPEGNVTCYRYEENGRMRAVKNPRGILTVRNEYDEKGRITRQKFPDKGQMSYAYDERKNTTTLTERNGSVITYVQDEKLRNTQIIYHDSKESSAYNDRNQKTSHTDRNGNTTRYHYDQKGNITAIINPLGITTNLTYNADGKLLTVRHAGKEIIRNDYDSNGRITKSTDALGRTMENAYDERGLIKTVTAPDKSRTHITHDEKGNILTITDPYGVQTAYTYDELNRIIKTTDGNGNETRYTYDKKDRLLTVTNPEGNSRKYTYNPSGKVEKVEDFDGRATTIDYNNINKPECLTDKEGRQTKRHYDKMWNISEETSPTGAVTKFTYDMDNRLSEVTLSMAEGEEPVSAIRYTHDPAGNLIQIQTGTQPGTQAETQPGTGTQPDNKTAATTYEYDALNRITRAINETGGITSYEYDETGKLTNITDPAGNRTTYAYNEAGELLKETDSSGRTLTYEYNALGQPVRITDALGRTTTHTYEKGGRLLKTTHPDGREITYTYDNNGNVKTKQNSDGYTLTYTYDCMNRVRKVTGNNGQQKTYEYDVMGNVTAMTDANGNTTAYEYTPAGKLSAVTDALGNRTEYAYDPLDNLILITRMGEGEEEHKTEYIRNPLGQIETIKDALGQEEHYAYDTFGRMKEKTDRDGNTTTYTYEPDGKTKTILYADGKSVEMQYDALRKLTYLKDWLGETKIDRDASGQIQAVTDHTGKTVTYSHGKMGERTAITYPDGQTVSYRYDEQLRLTELRLPDINTYRTDEAQNRSLTDGGTENTPTAALITYHYDETGRLTEKHFPGSLRTLWRYGKNGELTQLTHEDKDGVLDRYTYEYDPMGNKTAITRQRRGLEKESGRYEYAYDALCRLATVTKDGEALRNYAYDTFGNRTMMEDHKTGRKTTYAYDLLDRLHTRTETRGGKESIREYLYDNRGNLTEETIDGRILHTYAYNALNRIERAWNQRGEKAAYEYNGLGQRTAKQTGEKREDYLLDLTRPYHNLLGMVKGDEAGKQYRNFYWDRNVAAMSEKDELHYYLQDELGSPVRVSGYDTDYLTYGYDEFGNDLYDDLYNELEESGIPNPYSRQGKEQPFGYTGYRYDDISGTYFAQAREYQPESGIFLSCDKEKFWNKKNCDTINRYKYCINNPIRFFDPKGFEQIVISGGITSENYSEDGRYEQFKYQFIETALNDLRDKATLEAQCMANTFGIYEPENITWIVMDYNYTSDDIEKFQEAADLWNVELIVAEDKEDLIEYINTKNDNRESRENDKISTVSIYSHGLTSYIGFAYDKGNADNPLNFYEEDIMRLEGYAFDNTYSIFYSCNTGTGDNSLAQAWSNVTGGTTRAVSGRTDYANINVVSLMQVFKMLDKVFAKQSREENGFSYYGSVNYPTTGSDAEWKSFVPCDIN